MKTICAWCNLHINGRLDAKNVSHGICLQCSEKFKLDLGKQVLKSYLKGREDMEKELDGKAQVTMEKLGI